MANDWRELADRLSGSTRSSASSSTSTSSRNTSSSSKNTSTSSSAKSSSSGSSGFSTGSSVSSLNSSTSWRSLADELTGTRRNSSDYSDRVSQRVITRATKKDEEEEEEEKRSWLKKGSDSIAKRILGTGADVLEDITAGILNIGETAVDAIAMIAPYASNAQLHMDGVVDPKIEKEYQQLQKDAQKEIDAFVQKDLYDAQAVARKLISGVGSSQYLNAKIQNGGYLTAEDLEYAQELNKPVLDYLENDMENDSVLGERSDALVQSAGQLAGQYGLSMVGVPWFVTAGVTSFGGEAENALKQGATHEEAVGSAAISTGAEIISEKLFGGDLFVGKSGSDLATKYLSSSIANKSLRTLSKLGVDAFGEGLEEVFSQGMSNLGSALYREEKLGEILFSEQALDEYLESFWGGFALGGAMGGINAAQSKTAGVDFTSDLTANEEKVVQKELENRLAQEKGNVSPKQKAKMWEKVVQDMEKGRISIETIEEVLGGEAYDKYNAAMNNKKDNDFLNSYEELRKKNNPTTEDVLTLSEMKPMFQSITDYRNQTKNELSSKVSEFVRGDRLSESYNEITRRTQKFEADLSKYDVKQAEIVQKAIDSGVLNNTNRSHEFVDVIAKIHAEKDIPFDFTNNSKLKESGFAIEGATVDGFVNENGITINMQSPKAWQTTVGHEITHVLKGTEFYSELQNVLFEYAKPKGDYKSRFDTLKERYKDVYKDSTPEEYEAKINAEVTADLIGEYLFTDENFVNNLTANKNVFQKVYDEIKYLYKVATAGSQEARDIERIKKAFDKAYREGNAQFDADVKYKVYDKPNFTKDEWSIVNRKKFAEFDNPKYTLDTDRNWMYFNEKGMTGFAIYSKHDAEDPTVLYGSRGKKAEQDHDKLNRFFEEGQNYAANNRTTFDRILNDIKSGKGNTSNGVSPVGERGTAIGDVFLPFGEPGSNGGRDLGNGSEVGRNSALTEYNDEASEESGASFITFSNDYATIRNFMKEGDTGTEYSLSDKATNPNGYATPASDLMYAPVSETENVAPAANPVADSAPVSETETKYSVNTEPETEKPVTTADKAREHYRGDMLNRGDILSKLVNTGKTTFKAVDEATKQAQTLISKGAEGVKSIGEIFGRISTDGKLGEFEDYLHHLLNVDRRTMMDRFGLRDRPVWSYSAEESQKRADKLAEENPEFVKAAEDVYAFNDYIMSVRVKSGKITQEQADIWKQYYPHYVPISRGGADTYKALLKFTEGDTTVFKTLDDFSNEADLAADVYKIKRSGHDFDALMDTMVNAAFTAHWGLAISENGVTAPVAPVETQQAVDAPVTETATETQTEDYVPSAEKAPSPDAVQPADHESIKLMEQADGVKGKVLDAVHWAEDNILDNGRVFEKIDHKKGNRNLYSHWHAIRNAFSSAQYFIGKGNSTKGVRALNDIYAEIKKDGSTSDFDSYLAHQRNIDGMTMQARYGVAANRDFIKGVSAAQSYKEVLKLQTEHPQFKQWAKDIYANTGYVIDQMVEHKMLSQDMADLFKELYPHYVPMRYGKNGALESGLESLGQFTMEAFNSFAMNDFGLELKHTLRSEINREDMNIDTFIDRLDSGNSLFDFDVNGMDEDYHTFTIYEDGELKTFDITREMYMAMNQTRNWMDWKIPLLYQANEGFRKATTELNWIFAATNGVKDPQEILWNSQHPLETYAKFLPAEAAVWSKDSKYRNYYEEYLANGGESVEYFNPNKNTFDADKGVLSYLNQKIGTGAISNLNGRIETAPRLAEYIASREAGKNVQESMLDAAQVTVNFQAGGKLTKFLNRNGCTFLNASVQGALQHVRNIQEGKQNAWKGVSALIAKGMVAGLGSELVKQINHLLWDDDDEYENLPDYIKQDYYLFGKFGDGTWLRLPKGRTNATIEEAIRQVALSSTGSDEADWDAFWKLVGQNLAPNNPFTNNLLAPILEVKNNTTWYGEDLVPYRLRVTKDENGNEIEIPAVEQFDEKTDSLSVWLGEQLDYSPKKINYLINSYTGVIGDTFLPMGTPKAESPDDGLLGKLVAPLKDKFTTDAVLNHRVTGDFYETLEAAEALAESEDATPEDKFKSDLLIGYNVEISKLMQEQRDIQTSDLSDSEKYKRNRELKEQINALQKKGLEALNYYSIDGIYAEAGDKRYNYDSEEDTWWEVKPKTSDGEDNWYYTEEQLFHDNLGVDYADYWNGRLNPEDYNVKSFYDERNGKRYNFDTEKNAWFEIAPKLPDGKDNYYYQQEQRITKDLGISYKEYWNHREMYDDFYYVAGGYDKDSTADDTIETARAVFGYERFSEYAKVLKEIKADKDPKTGESISGTKYPKVQAYVNSLDIPDIEKKILYTMQYPNYKKYKGEIVRYLDENDDISYTSFWKILDELGYKVDKNGYVTWW